MILLAAISAACLLICMALAFYSKTTFSARYVRAEVFVNPEARRLYYIARISSIGLGFSVAGLCWATNIWWVRLCGMIFAALTALQVYIAHAGIARSRLSS